MSNRTATKQFRYEQAVELRAQGVTGRDAAAIMGIELDTVWSAIRYARRRQSSIRGVDFAALHPHIGPLRAAGLAWDKVADKLGVTDGVLRAYRHRVGNPWPVKIPVPDRPKQALALHESGLTFVQVGERMGITEDGARGMASRARRARG